MSTYLISNNMSLICDDIVLMGGSICIDIVGCNGDVDRNRNSRNRKRKIGGDAITITITKTTKSSIGSGKIGHEGEGGEELHVDCYQGTIEIVSA